MTECKHNYVYVGSTGRGVGGRKIKVGRKTIKTIALTLSFYCTKCKRSLERKATPGERAFHKQNCYALYKPMSIHKVWHDFRKRFMKKGSITEFKWSGYDLMLRVERWAKKYPDDVRICSVDDSHFCGSYLVLIESKNKNTQPVYEPFRYMGTNVVFIPQCSGESPIQFFLYPSHRDGLLKALMAIKKAAEPIKDLELKEGRKHAKLVSQNLQHPPKI